MTEATTLPAAPLRCLTRHTALMMAFHGLSFDRALDEAFTYCGAEGQLGSWSGPQAEARAAVRARLEDPAVVDELMPDLHAQIQKFGPPITVADVKGYFLEAMAKG